MRWLLFAAGAFALICVSAEASVSVGAFIPGVVEYTADIGNFNTGTGKDHALILFFRGMDNTGADDVYLPEQVIAAGAVPVIGWETGSYTYDSIIAGAHDDYIRTTAKAFRDLECRILISINSEMNHSSHYPGTPSTFVEMWRHVHDIWRDAGATNIEWIWAPNYASYPLDPSNHYSFYYPGDDYVDWVGTEGFNWNDANMPNDLFNRTLTGFASRYPNKPAMIFYMGAYRNSTQEQADWITDAYGHLKSYGNLRAVLWWNDVAYDYGYAADFRVFETSYPPGFGAVPAEVTDAYANAICGSSYISTLPPYPDLVAGLGTAPTVYIDLSCNKYSFSTTDHISITANVQPISTPFYPYIRLTFPNGNVMHYVSGLGFRGRVLPFLEGGPFVLYDYLGGYSILEADFTIGQTGTFLLEGYAVDGAGNIIGCADSIFLTVH